VAVVNSGFDGTVTESSFSQMMRGAGMRDSVATSAAWLVTQGTGRQVSVAAGVAYATGVVSVSDAAQLASLSTPVNGQWHLVVRRVNWTSNTVTVATIPHTITTTTIPTVPPTTYPTFNDSEGVLLDQWLAWAWVRSTDTTVTLFDLRTLSNSRQIRTYRLASLAALNALTGLIDGDQGFVTTGTDTGDYLRTAGVWTRTRVSGSLLVTITAANTDVNTAISFGTTFAVIPNVTASPSSTIASVGISSITTTGFLLATRRTSTTNTVVTWIAVMP
jgi:hypothetical protein